MSDILYKFESQFREKRILWRVFELAPLRYSLARGRIFRWFGINIPFSLVGGEGDIDLLMALRDLPVRNFANIYETLELKTTLISRDGRAISLKRSASKAKQLIGQLKKYREWGSPSVSLLEIYVCQHGFFEHHQSLPREVLAAMDDKLASVAEREFGYFVVVLQHNQNAERSGDLSDYFGLRALITGGNPPTPMIQRLAPPATEPRAPFTVLTTLLEKFVEQQIEAGRTKLGSCIVTLCTRCRKLIVLDHRNDYRCGQCGDALVMQTT